MTSPQPSRGRLSRCSASGALLFGVALTLLTSSCEPELDLGDWNCARASFDQASGEAGAPASSLSITVPWSTSFEDGFCGYSDQRGFCYADADAAGANASYKVTSVQAHSGKLAAAFQVNTNGDGQQARCVLEGILPTEAYYGAWFFIPKTVSSASNWNLMHFQGDDDGHGLWDVTVGRSANGGLFLYVYDFLHGRARMREGTLQVPIATWFRVVFFWRRTADETGVVELYQDDQRLLRLTNIATDDSSWAQWYSGNLAKALSPPDATIYMDDVTIDTKL
jgi:hypothetical protein